MKKLFIFLILIGTFSTTICQDIQLDIDTVSLETEESSLKVEETQESDSSSIEQVDLKIITLPVLEKFIKADYPKKFVKRGFSGSVIMDLLINEKGQVDSVFIAEKLDPTLDSLAMIAAYQFTFSPAILNSGDSSAVILQYRYDFKIDEVVSKIEKFVNVDGVVKVKGGGYYVEDAEISLTYVDTASDNNLDVPFSYYMKKIAVFDGQQVDGKIVYTTTLKDGRFKFYSLPSGKVTIKIVHPDFKIYESEITINREVKRTLYFHMDKLVSGEYEILVIGNKEPKEVAKRTLSLQEIKRIPGVGGDALKVVQALPGVARASAGGGEIVMRGANTNDSRFFIDGVQLPWLYHFGGSKSTYNSEALETIEMYPGGFGSRYGGATAGIVEVKTREGSKDHLKGFADLNVLDASFLLEGPIHKDLSFIVSARRSYFGIIVEAMAESGKFGMPYVISPYYWDYTGKLNYNLNKNHQFSINFVGAKDHMKVTLPNNQKGSTEISDDASTYSANDIFNSLLISYKVKLNKNLSNELNYSITQLESNYSVYGQSKWDAAIFTHNVRDEFSIVQNDKIKYIVGTDLLYADKVLTNQIPTGDGTFLKDTTNTQFGPLGGYANIEIKPIKDLLLIPGLRADYYPELKSYKGNLYPVMSENQVMLRDANAPIDISARVTARYKIDEKFSVKSALGNYNQTPQPSGQATSAKWGNPKLSTTKASHYVVGGEYRFTDLLNIDLQFYRNYQWNIPRTPTADEIVHSSSQNATPKYIGDGKGRMTGMELLFKHEFSGRFFGWVAYTLSKSERWNFTEKRYSMYENDQTHNLQILGSFKLPKKWDVGFKVRYVTGNPETPIIGSFYDDDMQKYVAVYGDLFSNRIDPFVQLDLRVDKEITHNRFTVTLYADVQNVLYPFYTNPEFTNYNYDFTEKQVVGQFIIPAAGVKVSF